MDVNEYERIMIGT